MQFHPDKNPEAGDQFKDISMAYEVSISVRPSRPDKSGLARISGIWEKSPGYRPDFCDFARIF